jgi:hypothetical protein
MILFTHPTPKDVGMELQLSLSISKQGSPALFETIFITHPSNRHVDIPVIRPTIESAILTSRGKG